MTTTSRERIKQQSNQRLIAPWAIDDNEQMVNASTVYPRAKLSQDDGGNTPLPERRLWAIPAPFGNFPGLQEDDVPDTETIIKQLLQVLRVAGLVEEVAPPIEGDDFPGYQLPGAAMKWVAGDGTKPFHDIIRVPSLSETGGRTNPFFVEFYKDIACEGRALEAHEHTAQVDYEAREQREKNFREGRLPILYCSPTMELGVDIAPAQRA